MKKLWKVTCRGMHGGIADNAAHGIAYVVADDPEEAYRKVRDSLDKRDLGFSKERELSKVELLAAEANYPDCGHTLYT
jgi:hypothetical protein